MRPRLGRNARTFLIPERSYKTPFSPREPRDGYLLSLLAKSNHSAFLESPMVAPAANRRPTPQPPAGLVDGVRVVASDGRRISGDALEQLERLDDAVFAALQGDAAALEQATTLWDSAQRSVDRRLLDETKRHYIRRARSRFRRSQQAGDVRLPVAFAALEILGLLGERPERQAASCA